MAPVALVLVDALADVALILLSCTKLATAAWTPVPGQAGISGTGGALIVTDTNPSPRAFYLVSVRLP
jgi:hypothetical protein